jgi:hypothetical protein
MTDTLLALSHKYDSRLRCTLIEPRPGLFALFNGAGGELLYLGPWSGVLPAYQSRPVYVPRERIPTENSMSKHGINLANLEINI